MEQCYRDATAAASYCPSLHSRLVIPTFKLAAVTDNLVSAVWENFKMNMSPSSLCLLWFSTRFRQFLSFLATQQPATTDLYKIKAREEHAFVGTKIIVV